MVSNKQILVLCFVSSRCEGPRSVDLNCGPEFDQLSQEPERMSTGRRCSVLPSIHMTLLCEFSYTQVSLEL